MSWIIHITKEAGQGWPITGCNNAAGRPDRPVRSLE
jgi:hypothetical protein